MANSRESRFASSKSLKKAVGVKEQTNTKKSSEKSMEDTLISAKDQRQQKATGKRSDPNYQQISAYLTKKTYKKMKKKLLDKDVDMSELLETLVEKWNTVV